MSMQLEDGRGRNGARLGITDDNQCLALATVLDQAVSGAYKEAVYSISTELINLTTTGSYSGLIYIKNDSDNTLQLNNMVISTDDVLCNIKLLKNPSAGTLISAGTTLTPVNTNFSSGKTLIATALKGANGSTVTDGDTIGLFQGKGLISCDNVSHFVLGQNKTFALAIQPSATANIAINLCLFNPNAIGA